MAVGLKIRNLSMDEFKALPPEEKIDKYTIFFIKNANGHNSVYLRGQCYGQDVDADELAENIKKDVSKIINCDTVNDLPVFGNENNIYLIKKTNETYRWDETNLRYFPLGYDWHDIKVINGGTSEE